ncbi:DUF3017 domain-containing protein [Parafrankia sp. FMc6]|uniref:DUF3017 domain-containing protein n=1 Tax=Parafrankia soli TaxID=2599596 RepID=UPI0034D7418A
MTETVPGAWGRPDRERGARAGGARRAEGRHSEWPSEIQAGEPSEPDSGRWRSEEAANPGSERDTGQWPPPAWPPPAWPPQAWRPEPAAPRRGRLDHERLDHERLDHERPDHGWPERGRPDHGRPGRGRQAGERPGHEGPGWGRPADGGADRGSDRRQRWEPSQGWPPPGEGPPAGPWGQPHHTDGPSVADHRLDHSRADDPLTERQLASSADPTGAEGRPVPEPGAGGGAGRPSRRRSAGSATGGRLGRIVFGGILGGVALGLLFVSQDHWRRGLLTAGDVLLVAALLRLCLPTRQVGMLAVRGRVFDTVTLVVLGTAVIVLTSTVPYSGG